ncbi:MrcB family domain-containing protein [Seonamhaeicola maritimus]|uniref:EVE domain-containing protein n=1 Tax=Seonamhaeicola maritimus TaxID=2591822 RepID=A0A5C7GI39_9FLAO|nr:DUF3578 domain-containing protein [Seonamhaeicola maritimus]TXG36971.1 EVE domain-containing protein [Seonamhaeicola maritimus]
MIDKQVMVYEIKSSANSNSQDLFHKSGQYFYWNQKMFRNLNIGDYVFVVNTHSNYVLFTKVESKDITVTFNEQIEESSFFDKDQQFRVNGKWDDFVCLEIIHQLDTPINWQWKSLGSSETTYLNGERVNTKASNNRLLNIQQLQSLSEKEDYQKILNNCSSNFKPDEVGFKPVLMRFLDQSNTDNLKTRDYIKNYLDTKVKVSFGQGTPAKISWISFLIPPNKTSKGIYPGYLYFKELGKLFLTYGVSETNKPEIEWVVKEEQTLEEYFANNQLGIPYRYGNSFVFKSYDVEHIDQSESLNDDLNELINLYKERLKQKTNYWVFQGNPKIYNVTNSLQDNALTTWSVKAHKDKIKKGDKVIIWVTGDVSGCYALAKVTSSVYNAFDDDSQTKYYTDKSLNIKSDRVNIEVEYNITQSPILKSDLSEFNSFEDFKGGNQGTNFSATRQQYSTILKLIESSKSSDYQIVKNQFSKDNFEQFINILRSFVSSNNLSRDDERISFNVRKSKNRLVFIVGTRYGFMIEKNADKTFYSFISDKQLSKDAGRFSDTQGNPVDVFWNVISSAKEFEMQIFDGLSMELNKNYKSPFRRFSNPDFIKDVYKKISPFEEDVKNYGNMNNHLNTILFGPPGTGKTYNSVNKSLEIINEDEEQALDWNNRDEVKSLFDRRVEEGRIFFTTFHQSMSYEDFIEGIKPVTKGGEVTYEVQDGIFKKICFEASKKTKMLIKAIDEVSEDIVEDNEMDVELFKEYYDNYVNELPDLNEKQSNTKLTTRYGKTFELFKNSSNSITVKAGTKRAPMSLSFNELSKVYFENKNPTYKSYASVVIDEILDSIEVVNEESDNYSKPYVLIIDEINRGNIASIFGELITLIEPDKREGGKEEIELILPYSKKPFKVPNNVFIIGTMNTADRSVEALDTALRRRFFFEEMPPKPELTKIAGDSKNVGGVIMVNDGADKVDLGALLKVINNRIEKLIDKDHKIGHSYFLKVDNENKLKDCFKNKIIPLLEEYFFGDFGKIGLVLGNSFVKKKNTEFKFANFKDYDPDIISDLEIRDVYKIKSHDAWDFKSIF